MKQSLRVVHLSTRDTGGANQAAILLHRALIQAGVQSWFLTREKQSGLETVIKAGAGWNWWRRQKLFPGLTFNQNQSRLNHRIAQKYIHQADVVCIHWIDNFLAIADLQLFKDKPIVWTLMDGEPVLGGYHYPLDFHLYQKHNPNQTKKLLTLAARMMEQKQAIYPDLNLTWITPSTYTEQLLAQSPFAKMPHQKIFLSVNTKIMRPGHKNRAREYLGIPVDKKVIFYGARNFLDVRKGTIYLDKAIQLLRTKNIYTVSVGKNDSLKAADHQAMGMVDYPTLALLYQAADVFVCPSIEDAGPMMLNEAVMCGVPIAAFDTGVARDLITHSRGRVVKNKDAHALAYAIDQILASPIPRKKSPIEVRCTPEVQAKAYIDLFKSL